MVNLEFVYFNFSSGFSGARNGSLDICGICCIAWSVRLPLVNLFTCILAPNPQMMHEAILVEWSRGTMCRS